MKKLNFKEFYDEVFFSTVLFYWGCGRDRIKKHLDKKYDIDLESNFNSSFGAESFYFTIDRRNHYVIWVEGKKDFYGLSHEITHTVFKIFDHRGIPVNFDNQETFAYYHDYWLRKLWRCMR